MTKEEFKDRLMASLRAQLEENRYIYELKATASFGESLYVRLDSLKEEDWPHGISKNSIYVTFLINVANRKVEVAGCGHIYLSPSDRRTERYKYLAMKSMIDVLADYGGRKFRKQPFKTEAELARKMVGFYDNVMEAVEKYTGGYPYKQGIEE